MLISSEQKMNNFWAYNGAAHLPYSMVSPATADEVQWADSSFVIW